jgi:hypothetical protein
MWKVVTNVWNKQYGQPKGVVLQLGGLGIEITTPCHKKSKLATNVTEASEVF